VLAVKDNQPKLHQALQEYFAETREDQLCSMPHRCHETHETGHGRLDDRYYYLAKLPNDFAFKKQWPGIMAIGMAIRITEKSGDTTSADVRYFIARLFGAASPEKGAPSTFHPRALTPSVIWAGIPASQGECGERRQKRQSHRVDHRYVAVPAMLASCHLLTVAKLWQCLSSGSMKLTPWSVLSAVAIGKSSPWG